MTATPPAAASTPPWGPAGSTVLRLLVTGIPGTGKTTLGHHLERHHRLAHVDLEDEPTAAPLLARLDSADREAAIDACADALATTAPRVVVTWGFVPEAHLELVLRLRERGFTWVWFDGDRTAARQAFLRRGTVAGHHFDPQVAKLDRADIGALGPTRVSPFDPQGRFRPVSEIADEVLALAGDSRCAELSSCCAR